MRLNASAPPRRLFVYGTLRDARLFAAVAGVQLSECGARPAHARGVRALVGDHGYPVLTHGGTALGLLLVRISPRAWARLCFFELGDYSRATLLVRILGEERPAAAAVFWPDQGRIHPRAPWSLDRWQRTKRNATLLAARQYMAHWRNRLTNEQTDKVWSAILSELG